VAEKKKKETRRKEIIIFYRKNRIECQRCGTILCAGVCFRCQSVLESEHRGVSVRA